MDPVQHYFYARLTEVEDRFGNVLQYFLDAVGIGPSDWLRQGGLASGPALTLIPSKIVATVKNPPQLPPGTADPDPVITPQDRTITIFSKPIPLPAYLTGTPAVSANSKDPLTWASSLRRVTKVIPPRGHSAAGVLLEDHAVNYVYASVAPTLSASANPYAPHPPHEIATAPLHFRPLIRTLRPEGMISRYDWITQPEEDRNPKPADDPQQWFFHTNLRSLSDADGVGYRFTYYNNYEQLAYNDEPETSPQGWYLKSGLRMYIRAITLPGGGGSAWSSNLGLQPAPGDPASWGIPPEVLRPEPSLAGFEVIPVVRAVRDAEGHRRSWVFDEHVIYSSDEIGRLLFPKEDDLRNLDWLGHVFK
jgi:hypothetical protein